MGIRVAILEDEQQTREMLADLIDTNQGYELAGAFEDAERALCELTELQPDVVLVDIHLPGMTGIVLVSQLKAELPDTQFIMCTSLEDADNIFSALQAGATGYLVKSVMTTKILEAITEAYNGGAPMSSQIARKVINYFKQKEGAKNTELDKLSAREQEILQYLSKGFRYKEIASMLFINIETVRKHIHNIYEKLQVNSRTDALNKVFPK